MSWNWRGLIKSIAPMLGTALGGPFGGLAGAALAKALGGDPTKTTEEELAGLVQNVTPEQLLALKSAEQQFKLQMAELEVNSVKDLETIAAGDRDSARNREIQVKDHTPAIGFYFITAGFFGLLTMLLYKVIPTENKSVLDVMVGSLGTAWVGAVGYYYGSTAGSREKNGMLHKSTPTDGGV